MKTALALAKKALGQTSPNPMVGAIVVDKRGEVVGQGWHRGPGFPHAEVVALEQAGERAQEAPSTSPSSLAATTVGPPLASNG